MDRRIMIKHTEVVNAFIDELEKISSTVIMKELTPAAKAVMNRMTGFGRRLKPLPPKMVSLRDKLRHDLKDIPIMSDPNMKDPFVRKQLAKRQEKLHGILESTGRLTESPSVRAIRQRANMPTVEASPVGLGRAAA